MEEHLSRLAVVQPEVVAGLEVEGNGGVRDGLQVHGQNLLGHVVVVQLVVTQSNVNLQGQEVPAGGGEGEATRSSSTGSFIPTAPKGLMTGVRPV